VPACWLVQPSTWTKKRGEAQRTASNRATRDHRRDLGDRRKPLPLLQTLCGEKTASSPWLLCAAAAPAPAPARITSRANANRWGAQWRRQPPSSAARPRRLHTAAPAVAAPMQKVAPLPARARATRALPSRSPPQTARAAPPAALSSAPPTTADTSNRPAAASCHIFDQSQRGQCGRGPLPARAVVSAASVCTATSLQPPAAAPSPTRSRHHVNGCRLRRPVRWRQPLMRRWQRNHGPLRASRNRKYLVNSGWIICYHMRMRWLLSGVPPEIYPHTCGRDKKKRHKQKKNTAELVRWSALQRCALRQQQAAGSSEKIWMVVIWCQTDRALLQRVRETFVSISWDRWPDRPSVSVRMSRRIPDPAHGFLTEFFESRWPARETARDPRQARPLYI